jgi:hypothetical protein
LLSNRRLWTANATKPPGLCGHKSRDLLAVSIAFEEFQCPLSLSTLSSTQLNPYL